MTSTTRRVYRLQVLAAPDSHRRTGTIQVPTRLAALMLAVFVLAVASAGYFAGSRNSPPVVLTYAPATHSSPMAALPAERPATGFAPDAPLRGGAASIGVYPAPAAVAIPGVGSIVDALNGLKDAIVKALDVETWIPSIFTGLADSIVGKDGLGKIASDIGAWLVHTPNVATGPGSGGLLGSLAGYIQAAAVAAMLCVIALTVFRVWAGVELSPQTAIARILVLSLLLALYRPAIGWAIEASNGMSAAIFAIDSGGGANVSSQVRNSFFAQNAVPGWIVLNAITAVMSFFMLMAIGFVRILSIAAFMVMYVIGPLALLTAVFPNSGWFDRWWRVGVQTLVWPVMWAVELKLFLVVGTTLAAESIAGAFFAPLLQLALLYVMFKTPGWVRNSEITARAQQSVRRVHTRTVERVSTIRSVGRYTLKGAAVGAAGGSLAGGVGAGPGAVAGATSGFAKGVQRETGVRLSETKRSLGPSSGANPQGNPGR